MKKALYLIPVLFLASCKADSAFGGGLWSIPLALFVASAWSFGRYFFGWRMPFGEFDQSPKKSFETLVYAIILAVAGIAVLFLMLNDK